jgi:hypothetical protein
MKIITLDIESYFDRDYTLGKLSTEEYVRSPRFAVIGCAVRWHGGELRYEPARLATLRRHSRRRGAGVAHLC